MTVPCAELYQCMILYSRSSGCSLNTGNVRDQAHDCPRVTRHSHNVTSQRVRDVIVDFARLSAVKGQHGSDSAAYELVGTHSTLKVPDPRATSQTRIACRWTARGVRIGNSRLIRHINLHGWSIPVSGLLKTTSQVATESDCRNVVVELLRLPPLQIWCSSGLTGYSRSVAPIACFSRTRTHL